MTRLARLPILCLLITGMVLSLKVEQANAQTSDAIQVVQMINDLRARLGLPLYQPDPSLFASAQGHSDWAASVGTHSHTGPGGSTPTDRARASGYGFENGGNVSVSENIYWGTSATPISAFGWWSNSDIHYRGMTSGNYSDIGAGVTYDVNGAGYFTVMFGRKNAAQPTPIPQVVEANPAPPSNNAAPVIPITVTLAEPREDGSVIHTVETGQTLWLITDAYDVPLSEVLALNFLTEQSVIVPGQEIIIIRAPIDASANSGPITHLVKAGQTPLGIAWSYGIELETLLALNGLTETSIIQVDQELIIRPAVEVTATPEATSSLDGTSQGMTPAFMPTLTAGSSAATRTPLPLRSSPAGDNGALTGRQIAVGALIVVGVAGLGLMVAGVLIKREGGS